MFSPKKNKKGGSGFVFARVYGRFLSISSANTMATMIMTTITAAIAVYKVVAETPVLVVVDDDVEVVVAADVISTFVCAVEGQ